MPTPMSSHLRASAKIMETLSDIYASNAELAPNHTAADAWNTAALRLLDAQQALEQAADEIEGLWRPMTDSRQLALGEAP